MALSTCDTENWFTLEKWADPGSNLARNQRKSFSDYDRSVAVGQRDAGLKGTEHHLRQSQTRLTKIQRAEVAMRYEEGATVYELAALYGCHRSTISTMLREGGVHMRLQSPTALEVDMMVRLYQSGLSMKAVGLRCGFSPGTIGTALRGRGTSIRDAHERMRN